MYFNRYNISWITCLGILFFISYGSVNHLTAFMDTIKPVQSIFFSWEHLIPFIPFFIIPYMSVDFLYGLAFFIIPKNKYSPEKYKVIIKSLGIQLLVNQIFSLICFISFPLKYSFSKPQIPETYKSLFDSLLSFDLPYNQSPSLHISIVVILMTFYTQHLPKQWMKIVLNIWFILIGLSVLFTYQHHVVDIFMGLFCGMAVVLMFNHSPKVDDLHYYHINHLSRETKVYQWYVKGIYLSALLLFIVPVFNNINIISYSVPFYLYLICWASFISLIVMFKVMFYGSHFAIRKSDHKFNYTFILVSSIYVYLKKFVGRCMNLYIEPKEIVNNLYIGSYVSIRKATKNSKYHTDEPKEYKIINLAWEMNNINEHSLSYPLIDMIIPVKEQVIPIADKIHTLLNQGQRVYLHCALGQFRTILVLGTYLIKYEAKTPQEVINFICQEVDNPRVAKYLKKNEKRYLDFYKQL